MKNKILKSLMALCLCGLMLANVNFVYGIKNPLDELPQDDEVGGGGSNGVVEYRDFYEHCTATKVVTCSGGFSYGYIDCTYNFSYTLDVDGTKNNCMHSGNKDHTCYPFVCRAN